jgi:hypothetical protein
MNKERNIAMKEENKVKEKKPDTEQEAKVVIDESMIPMKNPEVTVREEIEEDGKYILFNAENELILVINPTGKFVFDNCDGKKTVGQIVKDIEDEFTVKEDMDLSFIVKEFVSTLLKAKLVKIKEEVK